MKLRSNILFSPTISIAIAIFKMNASVGKVRKFYE